MGRRSAVTRKAFACYFHIHLLQHAIKRREALDEKKKKKKKKSK